MRDERILRRRAPVTLLLGTAAVLVSSLAAAGPVQVPGSPVSMDPPAGFRLSESFTGFENPDTRSSILVAELPGDSTVLVTIDAVGEDGPDRDAAVAALESITLSASPSLAERLELLPFGFEAVAPFETRRVWRAPPSC